MKKYDFDEVIDRKGTYAVKTDVLQERYGRGDLIALWVADMDFRCGDFIIDALKERVEKGIFGYTCASDGYSESIIEWVKKQHQWEIRKEWLSYIPGIVKGIAFCVMKFTNPGDKVIIQPPVYHPFRLVPQRYSRQTVNNPLIEDHGKYRMDLDGLKRIIDKDCKMLLLCNPHNPAGIIWDRETLQELAQICAENGILVVSDEIHADMGLFGHKHLPFAKVSQEAAGNSITFMAPSKTFNIAGIVSSYSIIPNPQIRESFYRYLHAGELDDGTVFAYVATEAAYRNGADWMRQMLDYVEGNILFTDHFLKRNIPQIKAVIPEASFLIWLDCRELGLKQPELVSLFVDKAHLALNDGEMFGEGGTGFMRMNAGCSRIVLKRALEQLYEALSCPL
ncbi:MAG: PatB family C-S lyase [Dysgonamonadaceae bacterium]|jgi:cystathionine beta-lyase|nr:PatB family C-S lyase [Dysgonamonadaceae bacterium]